MSTETRLKPCPFCGGAAKEFERFNANVITCRRCGVKVRQSEMGEGDAAERWNQRATPVAAQPDVTQQTLDDVMAGIPARDAEIEALRKEIDSLRAQPPVSGANGLPVELSGVAQEIAGGSGFWRSCSGCHELNEGHDTGPQSKVFQCALGNGCSECGGIGAIWDTTDYDAMGDALAAGMAQPQPSGNAGELPAIERLPRLTEPEAPANTAGLPFHAHTNVQMLLYGRTCAEAQRKTDQAALQNRPQNIPEIIPASSKQDADKVDAALADMVHAMFRSGNSVPVTRITIDRKQYDAAIDAARKEQA